MNLNQHTGVATIPTIDGVPTDGSGPVDAVIAWWTAMEAGDLATLAELLAEDYVVSGGPGGRIVGRQAVLDQASAFASQATIDDWTIEDVELRAGSDHAVCCYGWTERGTHAGVPFALRGVATDVLRVRDATWVHQARHVSIDDAGPAHDEPGSNHRNDDHEAP
jgi:ketosteroid isomerase-like protein